MPYSNGPRKKSGKMVTMSAFIAEPKIFNPEGTDNTQAFPVTSMSSVLALFPSLSLLAFLLSCQRSVHLEQAFRQVHAHLLAFQIHAVEICLGERNLHPAGAIAHNQERRFARSKFNILNASDVAAAIKHCTTHQVANVIPARLQLRALTLRDLQLASHQRFGLGNRIHSGELENQQPFVRPEILPFKLAPGLVRFPRPCQKPDAQGETLRNVAVNLARNFAAAALRFQHASQRNEVTTGFRLLNGAVPAPAHSPPPHSHRC